MQGLEETSSKFMVITAIVAYSLCSSTLLLANKVAINYLPAPAAISFMQIVFASLAVVSIKAAGVDVDWFEWSKVKPYLYYIAIFVAAIYSNMQALQSSNVETVIVFRACSPIAVSVVDYFFLNREVPSSRSMLSLGCIALGAIIYCVSDSQFSLNGLSAYYWVTIYFLLIVVEMTYGKVLTAEVKMKSVWGPVLYCNALSIPPMFLLSLASGEFHDLGALVNQLPLAGLCVLLFSCIVGTLIGYSGWLARSMVSATTYTLVGVVNKFLTVLLNVVIWDKHSTPLGLFAVCGCLLAGVFYKQAPKRNQAELQAAAATATPMKLLPEDKPRKPAPTDPESQKPLVQK